MVCSKTFKLLACTVTHLCGVGGAVCLCTDGHGQRDIVFVVVCVEGVQGGHVRRRFGLRDDHCGGEKLVNSLLFYQLQG